VSEKTWRRVAVARSVGSLLPLIAPALAWEVSPRSGMIGSFLLPPLSAVLERL
jgi:ABC-type nitrate/sulfonate/bicarbonate transport system permease component